MSEERVDPAKDIATHFSWLRTRMSADRTLEAWIRTSVSLIGFGFTVATFFERLKSMEGIAPERVPGLARYFGLLLVGIGTFAVIAATRQHKLFLRYLQSEQFRSIPGEEEMPGWSPSLSVAVSLAVFGSVLFIVLVIRSSL